MVYSLMRAKDWVKAPEAKRLHGPSFRALGWLQPLSMKVMRA